MLMKNKQKKGGQGIASSDGGQDEVEVLTDDKKKKQLLNAL